ncbi:MAG: peptide-methionine (S)-S-oxide reductase MsrA [Ignavibacteriales bacterium]|nr:peptide-methionine (S)-S-oxide reductase MsrA [Ignavibacteriales bacterium]
MKIIVKLSLLSLLIFLGCNSNMKNNLSTAEVNAQPKIEDKMNDQNKYEVATFGAGCFWCTEAVFQRLKGVVKIESGYSGGTVPNPSYEAVCTGKTGQVECTQITFDPKIISYKELLEVFWKTHDPTTLNRQGHDSGTQYRSVIFYHNDEQKQLAEKYKNELESAKIWSDPIVTEISQFKKFYKAEDYHQNYYNQNGNQPYCSFVITPKIEKFKKVFADKLKKE